MVSVVGWVLEGSGGLLLFSYNFAFAQGGLHSESNNASHRDEVLKDAGIRQEMYLIRKESV